MLELIKQLFAAAIADPAGLGILVGAFTPAVVAVLQRPTFSRRKRTIIGVASAIVLGAGATWSSGQIDGGHLLTTIAVLYTTSEAMFQKLWKASGLAQKIEEATSPKVDPEPEPEPLEVNQL